MGIICGSDKKKGLSQNINTMNNTNISQLNNDYKTKNSDNRNNSSSSYRHSNAKPRPQTAYNKKYIITENDFKKMEKYY